MSLPLTPEPDSLLHKVRAVARAVAARGGRALLVGGYVRDTLLGREPKDADVEVFGLPAATLHEVLRRLGRVNCVGESFQVYKLGWHERRDGHKTRHEIDISLPRRDRRIGQGHRGFVAEGDPAMSVEDAARRRDFTINAILCDPLSGEIIDPFDGRGDLARKVLRVVDAAHFAEDSLRVLRAAQFAARFELEIEPATVQLCRSIALDDLPRERIWGEWEKLLMKAARPSRGLRAAAELEVLDKLFPTLQTAMQRRGDELCAALDGAAREKDGLKYSKQITLMLAALGSFLGWRATTEFLDALNIHTLEGYNVRANVLRLVGERKRPSDWFRRRAKIEDKEFRFLAARVEPELIYRLARARGEVEAAAWFWDKMRALGVENGPPEPLLKGRDLLEMGLTPGPRVGQIVNAIWLLQLEGKVTTFDEAKAAARRLLEDNF